MPRDPLTTPASGSTSWYNWANQLGTEHESIIGTSTQPDAATATQIRSNIGASAVVQITQAAYTALGTKDPNTLYVIVD